MVTIRIWVKKEMYLVKSLFEALLKQNVKYAR